MSLGGRYRVTTFNSVSTFVYRGHGIGTTAVDPIVTQQSRAVRSYVFYRNGRPAEIPRFRCLLESEIPAFEVERLLEHAKRAWAESTVDQGLKGRAEGSPRCRNTSN